MATVIETTKISPPTDSVSEFSLPLLFFDIVWYSFVRNPALFFFDFPCSKSDFLETIVPDLKSSLSLALAHFLPLAGNIIHPLTPGAKPVLRYESGDSVCFTVSESNADFNHLTGNQPRDCDEFYAFAPEMPAPTRSANSISRPVLALQVTLFPGQGLCIGFVFDHAVADANTALSFIQAWALINRSSRHDEVQNFEYCLSFYDRKSVTNLNGLDSIHWEMKVKFSNVLEPPPVKFPTNKLRATFVLKKDEIEKLKNFVLAKCPVVAHLSSYTVICALFWVCSAKSAAPAAGEDVADDEPEWLRFLADCRRKLKPPLPANYFGNCGAPVMIELKHGQVKGPDGFVTAAKAIGEAIKERVYNEEKGILHGAENWQVEARKLIGKQVYGVAASPRFDFYAVDYGWGKPKKFEALFIDGDDSIFLSKSRDFEDGVEIRLSKPMDKMGELTRVFHEVLTDLVQ